MFDEVEINKKPCFDLKNDKILGPFSKVQVILIRGLCSNWKQPIFFDFNYSFTKENFLELLHKIEEIGLFPISVVCDYGPGNRKLLKELQISYENPVFSDSTLKNPVFFLADVPHMIKLLRNHVLDQGFLLASGSKITKNLYEKILKLDNGELKICHKLSANHLTVLGPQRQNVRKAVQLFSNTVGNFVLQFIPEESNAGNFILLIDKLFDLFNSFSDENQINPWKKAYIGSNEQNLLLSNAFKEISTMRVLRNYTKNNKIPPLLPFQIGLLQSINALQKLFFM